jgi:hypothetical protein
MSEMNVPKCEREGDVVSFLYGELSETETPAFQQHIHECASCSTELAGFKSVRKSVVAWRNESLGLVTSPAPAASEVSQPRPSALAALREFFSLSPLWMKGALALASVLFCLLAGLTIARWRTTSTPLGPVVVKSGYSQQEVDKMVAERVQAELDKTKELTPEPTATVVNQPPTSGKRTVNRIVVAGHGKSEYARRPLSKTEREQLAADLRLASANDSDIDLLGDSINQ